jgi:hypothetical protein
MLQTSERPEAMLLPEEPPRDPRRWTRLALSLILLAAGTGVLLFLLIVVSPSAGAAGGCGGG